MYRPILIGTKHMTNNSSPNNRQIARFRARVWGHYYQHGRHHLPWRHTSDPYRIAVSEVMLQQTQVSRVVPKYQEFLRQFPSTKRLAEADLASVLRSWQGLGYNRRAKSLWQCAGMVREKYSGRWPRSTVDLEKLPGIGPYTAAAIAAFAYRQPTVLIETNLRTVYLHHFFPKRGNVSEKELISLIAKTVDSQQPREWYWALMDYGAYIKQAHGNRNRQAKSYSTQSRFVGSDREIRGAIVRLLANSQSVPVNELSRKFDFAPGRIDTALARLQAEGLIEVTDDNELRLPNTLLGIN